MASVGGKGWGRVRHKGSGTTAVHALRERMLPLGETLSRMPLSPCLGRMLILGVLFRT